MADGLPNRAIADRLFLAQGTIKAHVNHINGKLLARNRTEAVAQARRLRVI
jgi:LuxR family maltose regulon positive regulatory protein